MLRRVALCAALLLVPSLTHAAPGRLAISKGALREGTPTYLRVKNARRGFTYFWDFYNDGSIERVGRRVRFRFSDSGRVPLVVRAAPSTQRGLTIARAAQKLVVSNARPRVSRLSVHSGTVGTPITISVRASDAGDLDARALRFHWTFGDGRTKRTRVAAAQHSFSKPGRYTVTVTAVDKDGARSDRRRATVNITSAPRNEPVPPAPPPVPPGVTPPFDPPLPPPPAGDVTRVTPREIHSMLTNPGIGWQSCDRVNTSGADAQGFPNSVAYIKYYWHEMEPQDGRFDFAFFEQNLRRAAASGQKMAFRIMMVDEQTSAPAWLRAIGVPGYTYRYNDGSGAYPAQWVPDNNHPVFLDRHARLLREIGRRFGSNPALDSVDIGTVGLWGEWHYADIGRVVPMPSAASVRRIIDDYFSYFPNIPKVAQLQDAAALKYAVSRGAGFRGDCWGNMNWQMPRLYPDNIRSAGASEAWRHAPVMMETCWDISYWSRQGWNVEAILQWALDHHASAVHNKNKAVPAHLVPAVERFIKRLGYRYVVRNVTHPRSVSPGQSFTVQTRIENKGVAPIYASHHLAFRLENAQGEVARWVTANDARQWMPGVSDLTSTVTAPGNLPRGDYTLSLAVLNGAGLGEIKLAIEGRVSGGWYPVGRMSVR